MAYLTREKDGERFVIPAYRDVLTVKNKNDLKKEILALSQSYGEYITLQKKSPTTYEVAFSPDAGYLLGESIWQYFKLPPDFIYCEALPDNNQAILVIVKNGSVYLDGSFALESIPDELVIFLTQEAHFEIYTYGDVPLTKEPESGKFSFDEKSVKSFTVLEEPLFQRLPLLKIYRLQLVEPVLKAHGIGQFPIKYAILGVVILGVLWLLYSYLTAPKPQVVVAPPAVNPYQEYNTALNSPDPYQEVAAFLDKINLFYMLPAWSVTQVDELHGAITANVRTAGGKIQTLLDYGNQNRINVTLNPNSVVLSTQLPLTNRPLPAHIYPIKFLLANIIDRLTTYIDGTSTHLQVSAFQQKGVYTDVPMTLTFTEMSPNMLLLLVSQFNGLPVVLQHLSLSLANAQFSGSMAFDVLGSG